jgi:prepilin-type N-terminal cleavage/methylation domain-containing protein
MKTKTGFTLIELLIVIGIISILSLIALPNFLLAQTRAKVAACKSDQRTLANSIEVYYVDFNHYPPASGVGPYASSPFTNPVHQRFIPITSPVAYMTSIPQDRFPPKEGWAVPDPAPFDTYDYVDADAVPTRGSGLTSGGAYRISSAGPDLYQAYGGRPVENPDANEVGVDYDATNGVISVGDIVRVGPLHTRYGDPQDPSNPNRPGILRAPNYKEQWR